ncbi:putative TIR domain, P-loop containing nucleoside triphosphate hydrolase [Helianthus annuus]|nr:putative TIR domain, P-loop containing nucleoside triphosphate hydrolase [Helianthus annuus]
MASTSASSVQKSFKYDVFLSFRGEDTRKTFVDHLYHALNQRGIITYKDDEKIEKGKRINDQLMRAIEDSRIYIIVFSKNYASSSWCLDELEKIMECHKTTGRTAYPIFFNVEPTEVRHQSGAVKEAFAKHEKKEAAGIWRNAMKEAADLAGRELKTTFDGHEAKFIQKIVEDISLELRFIDTSVDEKLIGMETRVKHVVSSLENGSDDVRMIGIKGIGGGGKTTLARAVFDHISVWFEGKSFVENVREASKGSGLKKLQKQVLKDVLNDGGIDVTSVSEGKNMMKKLMGSRKILVVLDNVDDIEQLEALAGDRTWFKAGSTIIITTRDEHVLIAHRVKSIHDVNLLSHEEGIRLFSKYAFGEESPIEGYKELSEKVVHYAGGLPLTIKVLGSSLCGKTECEWDDAIKRLKTIPEEQTLKRLEISYSDLENDHKEVFLEVACILKGDSKDSAMRILESCGFHARFALKVLEQKSLITVSDKGYLDIHDRIEEMGMNIVRRLHPDEPGKHSRLWIEEEIEDILVNDLGTEATRSIKMECLSLDIDIATTMKGFRKMKGLRFLHMCSEDDVYSEYFTLETHQIDQYLPNTLRYLNWHGYPFQCLPKTFQANMLVYLQMQYSYISQLWGGGERKVLNKLRFLDLSCSGLISFDLGMTPNLETLDLEQCEAFLELNMPAGCPYLETLNLNHCNNFAQLHMPVKCPKLKYIDLSCSMVSNLNLGMTPNLEILHLVGCEDFVELNMPAGCPYLETLNLDGCYNFAQLHMPVKCPKLKFIDLSCSKVSNFNIGMTPNLEALDLGGCEYFVELHMPFECPKLKSLKLSNSKVSNFNIGMTPNLEALDLGGCEYFVELHMPFECPKLKSLNLSNSKVSNLNLGLTPNLETLNLADCKNFVEFHMPFECPKLKFLKLSNSKVSNFNIGMTPNLEALDLGGCEYFVELHMPFECPKLKSLKLSNSKVSNLNLGLTPNLETLNLADCKNFVEFHMPYECPKLKFLYLSGLKLSNFNLGLTPNITLLDLSGCNNLVELQMLFEFPHLKYLSLSASKVSKLNLGLTPQLEQLILEKCYYLQEILAPMGCLNNLFDLKLSGCKSFESFLFYKPLNLFGLYHLVKLKLIVESVLFCPLHPNNSSQKFHVKCEYDEPLPLSSGNVEKLISSGLCACTFLESFSATICGLQRLGELTIIGSIPEAPKGLWLLEGLEKLTLYMKEIKHLPDNICSLKHLKYLNLKSCWLLEQLPKDLGRLESLEELDLTQCMSLRDIPNSICRMKCLKSLNLSFCTQVKNLPGELGSLECLETLNIEGSGIGRLPHSIFQLKDLCIVWSRLRLLSYGFTCLKEISEYTASSYVHEKGSDPFGQSC